MLWKRIMVFLAVVVVAMGTIAWTSPDIVKNVKLGLDLKGGFEVLYEATPIDGGAELTQETLKETARNLQSRIDKSGVEEPEITTEGTNRIRVRLPGIENEDEVRAMLAKPIRLTFRAPDGKVMLDGSDFVPNGAAVGHANLEGPFVSIKLKSSEKFGEVTKSLIGSCLGIYLDEDMLSCPKVNYEIKQDSAQISGNYTATEAKELRDLINMGALPLNLEEKYTQSVGAQLGLDSLEQTVTAGLIGTAIIFVGLIALFRIPGLVASICIIVYTWLLLFVFTLMNATLTLPGIAAFILGIGMAVDANIITYERVKEEIRSGKSLMSALKTGSRNSFRTIMDVNVTTIFSCIALYYVGDGAIKGFALTMILSVIVSMITNVYLSRFLVTQIVRSNIFVKPSQYGVKESEIRAL